MLARRRVNGRQRAWQGKYGTQGDRAPDAERRQAMSMIRQVPESSERVMSGAPGVCRSDFSHKSLISTGLWRKNGNSVLLQGRMNDLLIRRQLMYILISAI